MSDAFEERRQHPRFDVAVPMWRYDQDGKQVVATETINVSNGGALVAVPTESVPAVGDMLRVELVVPSFPDPGAGPTREVERQARVVRHQPTGDPSSTAIGLEFQQLLDLGLTP